MYQVLVKDLTFLQVWTNALLLVKLFSSFLCTISK